MRKLFLLLLILGLLAGCAAPTTGGPAAVMVETDPAQPAAEQAVEPETAQPEAATSEPTKGGRLVRAMTSEPATIDPQGAASSGLSLVMPYLFDTLVTRDVDGSLHPLLAESWETSDDGKAITVQLKPGITFHDGSPLMAEAVKLTFDRYKEKGVKSPIYSAVKEIGAVEVIDDLLVRFTFDQPSATFWSTVTMPYAGILSPASMEAVDATGEGHLIGTGPFVLGEWKAGQSLTLVANPDYTWGPDFMENQGAPYLSELVFKVIPEAATQMAALEVGEVDVVFVNQPSHLEKLATNPELRTEEMVLNSLVYLGFNSQKGPFAEPLVRQALSHAVDKQQILDIALGGLGQLAYTPLPPTLLGFDPALKDAELGYDPEQARSLLQEAGFEATADGGWQRDGQPLTALLLTSNRAPNEAIATLLQSQLQSIGVPVEIQQLDSKAVQDATNQGAFDLLLWRFEWNDPDGLRIFLGTEAIGSTNRTFYSNPDVDALLTQAAHELDPAARHDLYVKAQQLILQDAPWQPLYNPVDVMAAREAVQGVKIGYMGRMLVNDAFVEQECGQRETLRVSETRRVSIGHEVVPMLQHLLRRLVSMGLVLLAVTFITFMALAAAPGDAAGAMVGDSASAEQMALLRQSLGLDGPLLVRYQSFVGDLLLRGDLGHSLVSGRPVSQLLLERLPYTALLALTAIGLAVLLGAPLGMAAALRAGTRLDTALMGGAALGLAVPTFWSSLLLMLLFSLHLRWLPVAGAGSLRHLALPAVALALPTAAIVARLLRASLLDTLHADYVRTAHAKGLTASGVFGGHVLRNSLIPVLTVLGLQLGHLLGGAFVVETIFGWPGVGRLTVQAIFDRDTPVVLGAAITLAAIYLLINLAVDLAHSVLDPRVGQAAV